MKQLSKWLNKQWYESTHQPWFLKILSQGYALAQQFDKHLQLKKCSNNTSLPVIVVGNLSVGGTGKTPLIIAISKHLSQQGFRVGILTRGYKSQCKSVPYLVQKNDSASLIGDEAALLNKHTNASVVISPNRHQGLNLLTHRQLCDVVLCDDGLQHYALARNFEIAVIDGKRGFGNGQLLPLGPLREPLERLSKVDLIVINGECSPDFKKTLEPYAKPMVHMQLIPEAIYALNQSCTKLSEPLAAFAGIGNPKRFFTTLENLGLTFKPYVFPDHHHFQTKDFEIQESCIIMTEKDAMKCQNLTKKPLFVLPVEAKLDAEFWRILLEQPLLKAASEYHEDML